MAFTVKDVAEAPITAATKDEVKLLVTRAFLDDPEAEMDTENAYWEGDDFVVDGEVIAEIEEA